MWAVGRRNEYPAKVLKGYGVLSELLRSIPRLAGVTLGEASL